jgi:prophage regulatory protein
MTKATRAKASPHLEAAVDPDALLRRSAVEALSGYGRTSIASKVKDGSFPAPIKLNQRCSRWRAGDIRAWLEQQNARGAK